MAVRVDIGAATLYRGEALSTLGLLPDACVDSVVTDPPYHLTSASRGGSARVPGNGPAGRHRNGDKGFMGKTWDGGDIAFRPETWAAIGRVLCPGGYLLAFGGTRTFHRIACAIEDAGFVLQDTLCWLYGQGFPKHKSKLKPAWEPIIMAWKPAKRATALPGLDACRIEVVDQEYAANFSGDRGHFEPTRSTPGNFCIGGGRASTGRWPANVVIDQEAAEMLDRQAGPQKSGGTPSKRKAAKTKNAYGTFNGQENPNGIGSSEGCVSRFYYCAKASKRERGDSNHPTMKPIALMHWLVRLVTPIGGSVLDSFMGSGSTGIAAIDDGFRFVGIEGDRGYFEIAKSRIRRLTSPSAPSRPASRIRR